MTSIVLIESNGTLKALKAKDLTDESQLFKKCGFRNANGFAKRHTWRVNIEDQIVNVSLYAKDEGKGNYENKYDLPPPVDKELYFGTSALVRQDDNNQMVDLSVELWKKVYETLFGGFEDLDNEEDEESEDELDSVSTHMKTKGGYLKDGFVVEDSKQIEGNDEDEDESDDTAADEEQQTINVQTQKANEESTVKGKKRKHAVAKPTAAAKKPSTRHVKRVVEQQPETIPICDEQELEEEPYVYSDEDY